jgi:hypothetical protein
MGISPIGRLHTLGSLPAIPLALWMLARHGRIVPASAAGRAYFGFMLLGALTVFPIAHQPVSSIIATLTLLAVLAGYGLSRWPIVGRGSDYLATAALSISVFFLMVPAVSESMRRLPVGHPLVTDLKDPLLLGAQGALFLMLLFGVPVQLWALRRRRRSGVMAGLTALSWQAGFSCVWCASRRVPEHAGHVEGNSDKIEGLVLPAQRLGRRKPTRVKSARHGDQPACPCSCRATIPPCLLACCP